MTNETEAPERLWVERTIIGAEDGSHGSTAWAMHDPDAPDIEYRRADLSDAKDARIAELERTGQEYIDVLKARAEAAEAKLAKAEEALAGVEEWWLETGMHEFSGAPACIFKARATLAELKGTDT